MPHPRSPWLPYRRAVYQRAKQEKDVQVIFVESICNDPQVTPLD